jgi:hypothetical protein
MSNFEQDEIFSATEKELVQLRIVDRLHQELKGSLPIEIPV